MPSLASTGCAGLDAGGDRFDRVAVAREVAQRVGVGARAFAQHVVAESAGASAAPRWRRPRPALRRSSGRARTGGRAAAPRAPWPRPRCCAPSRRTGRRRRAALGQEASSTARSRWPTGWPACLCGPLGGGGFEVGAAELVGGQRDRGLGVGHAQQRLGQPHQRQALGAGDRVFASAGFPWPRTAAGACAPPAPRAARRRAAAGQSSASCSDCSGAPRRRPRGGRGRAGAGRRRCGMAGVSMEHIPVWWLACWRVSR